MKQYYMSRKFWKAIRNLIPHRKSKFRPRIGAKKIMRAIFYILRNGIPWNALPACFKVSSSTVHRRFQEWTTNKVFFNFWVKIFKKVSAKKSRNDAMDSNRWLLF